MNPVDLSSLRTQCLAAKPCRHVSIDGLWKAEILDQVRQAVLKNQNWAGEKDFYGSKKKRWQPEWNEMPAEVNNFMAHLNQPLVLRIIEYLTDETNLISDPYLEGGGIHSTGQDGFLKLHTDFNWNEKLQLYRRINILVYLNKGWQKEFGGQIELASKDGSGDFTTNVALDPIFNRTLIFVTDDHSYHGQPNPVKHPLKQSRDSLAAYYYQSKKPEGTASSKRTGTDYFDEKGVKIKSGPASMIKRKVFRYFK